MNTELIRPEQSFLETVKQARGLVASLDDERLKALKIELKSQREALRRKVLAEGKEETKKLWQLAGRLHTVICYEEVQLNPPLPRGETGRGHKLLAPRQDFSEDRRNFKGYGTYEALEAGMRQIEADGGSSSSRGLRTLREGKAKRQAKKVWLCYLHRRCGVVYPPSPCGGRPAGFGGD